MEKMLNLCVIRMAVRQYEDYYYPLKIVRCIVRNHYNFFDLEFYFGKVHDEIWERISEGFTSESIFSQSNVMWRFLLTPSPSSKTSHEFSSKNITFESCGHCAYMWSYNMMSPLFLEI